MTTAIHRVLKNRAHKALCASTGSLLSEWFDSESDLNIWDNDFIPGDPPNTAAFFRNPLPVPYPRAWITGGIVIGSLTTDWNVVGDELKNTLGD